MNKPKHLIHKIRNNDDGHYEKIGSALLDLWDKHIETGGIEERVTDVRFPDYRNEVHRRFQPSSRLAAAD